MRKHRSGTLLMRLTSIALALVLLLSTAFLGLIPAAYAAEGDVVTVKLHYHREDGNYADWDAYYWEVGGSGGGGVPFETEDNGVVATIVINPGISSIGYIVRKGGDTWAGKDIDKDQFLEFPEVASGTVNMYVESGVEGCTMEYGEDAVIVHRPSRVKYDENSQVILVTMTSPVENPAEAFAVADKDGNPVEITGVTETEPRNYSLGLAAPLDVFSSYVLTFDGVEYAVSLPNFYSSDAFEAEYTYEGSDLGYTWTADKTSFRVWAPTAESVTLNLYASGTEGTADLQESIPMTADVNGTWTAEKDGDLNGTYYTYTAVVDGASHETVDPYARTTGVNGKRSMVLDLDSTDPEGWDSDANPNADLGYTDSIIYELHVRDLSSDASSGIQNTGKFLGLAETGTVSPEGYATGLDHIKELGVTHIHLLPSYDYGSVDETRLDEPQFNWGYDPVNYNVPEGSYSTDPYHGEVRVAEMKQMVKALHDNGISVIMDVVYNHVQNAADFSVNQLVPGYFSRINDDGSYSNGSGCGNDTASERSMVHKFIVDSVLYWAQEYHIDGFRFDLVGLLDVDTVNDIVSTVHAVRPDVIFYGEGWDMATDVTKEGVTMATQKNSAQTKGFAYFSDNIRDDLKGSVFNKDPGFVSGATGLESNMVDNFKGTPAWSSLPTQTVNYASCHDNNTLIDRITLSRPDASREDLIRMNNLAAAFYLTAEGIPFMQAGEEMLRTKPNEDGSLNENSYNASDAVNSLKWSTLASEEVQQVFQYYKGLIAFRKAHAGLRIHSSLDLMGGVFALSDMPANVVAMQVRGGVNGESSQGILLIFNANPEAQEITLPAGEWDVYINDTAAGTEVLDTVSGTVTVAPISALVMTLSKAPEAPAEPEPTPTPAPEPTQAPAATEPPAAEPTQAPAPEATPAPSGSSSDGGVNGGIIALVVVAVAAVAGGAVYFVRKKK